jgi:acyl-CoA synthetase (AMP-forming)/AMP-acid ligase II
VITYADYLRRAARRWPERTAVVSPSASVTFAGLLASAEGLATGLRARGLGVGDRVADLRENSVESVVTDFGCALAGVTRVSVNPRSSDEEIAFVLRDSRPSLLLADGASASGADRSSRAMPRTSASAATPR